MKRTFLLLSLSSVMLASCTKTTNNNYGSGNPPFTVDGITDIKLQNQTVTTGTLHLAVNYRDSSQQTVTLSLSALPAGITMDTLWTTTGIPSFSSSLTFNDTTAVGAAPGTYPMTLTAASASEQKTYKFNLIVKAAPPCTKYVTGKYSFCNSGCGGSYADSIYADPSVTDKIWFVNFNGSYNLVYGYVSCGALSSGETLITIPTQTVGGITYAGTGFDYIYSHYIGINLTSPSSCSITEQL